MSILVGSNLTKRFGVYELFSNLTLTVNEHERVCLIGANGTGKTTLLKMLIGEEECSYNGEDKKPGTIALQKGKTVGYLSQKVITNIENTLHEEVLSVFTKHIELNKQFEAVTEELSKNPNDTKVIEKYDRILEEMNQIGAFDYLYQIKSILTKFGFTDHDFDRPISSFSGGERTKISFAKLILTKPDLLILDEPTNHLDISTIEWLTKYLLTYPGSILFVSHDRYFIDDVATRIIELENNKLTSYTGNYDNYVTEKKNNANLLLRQYKIQQREIAKLEWFIKFYKPKPRFAARAKDREKKLAKIQRISLPKEASTKLKLHLDTPLKEKKKLFYFDEISLGYDATLIDPFSFYLYSDDRIAIMGDNGTGKSTFLKSIIGEKELLSGKIDKLRPMKIGYLRQNDFDFGNALTPYDVINNLRPMFGKTAVRSHLGRFGFYDEDVFKNISSLSGGELMRLNLAKLVLEDYELLLLDEPTNNLDMLTKDAFVDALNEYKGAILVVTHDRSLVNEVCNKIIYFHNGEAVMVEGSYEDLKEQLIDEPEVKESKVVERQKKQGLTNNARKKLEDELTSLELEFGKLSTEKMLEEVYMNPKKMNEVEERTLFIESRILEIIEILEKDS